MTDEQWLKNLEEGVPYVPKYTKVRKLPKFNKKDMLFKKKK
jgi:hypothetical protein